jgi:DNA-directed RNA polymerase subunit omega
MARYTSEAAVEQIGNRFNLVLAASQRTRELKDGHMQRVEGKDANFAVTALREIEAGKYTMKDYLDSIPKKRKGQRDEYYPT